MSKPIESCHAAVGIRIKMTREFLSITQQELSKKMGISRGSLANIEVGRQRLLLNNIEEFAKALNVSPKHLLKGIWL